MKIRTGFVSNSSSTSFIICRSYINESQIDALEKLYSDCSENDGIRDDNGIAFMIKTNYVYFNANTGYKPLLAMLESFGIEKEHILRWEE